LRFGVIESAGRGPDRYRDRNLARDNPVERFGAGDAANGRTVKRSSDSGVEQSGGRPFEADACQQRG
jgi:hypothetical protein